MRLPVFSLISLMALPLLGQELIGEGPKLGDRLQQGEIAKMTLAQVRKEGGRIFTTPFNKKDGYGDGPMDPSDPVTEGNRPTLAGNGSERMERPKVWLSQNVQR